MPVAKGHVWLSMATGYEAMASCETETSSEIDDVYAETIYDLGKLNDCGIEISFGPTWGKK